MRFYLFRFIFVLAVTAAQLQTAVCQSNAELQKRVGEIAAANAGGDNFSGSVLLAKNGEIVYEKNFGFADREKRLAFTENTASNTASVGKMLTAVLILQLVDEKKLALSDSVRKFLPTTKIPNVDKITVRHLLMHTAGLGDYLRHPDVLKLSQYKVETNEILPLIEQMPLVSDEPGTRFQYSNSGYVVLGKIIEQVTGKRYADVLGERIIRRLNMKNTRFELDGERRSLAKGYVKPSENDDWQLVEKYVFAPSAAFGIFSTPKDLFRFSRALYGGKLLKPDSLEMMRKRQIEMTQPGLGKMNYGYGVTIRDYPNNRFSVGHNGGLPGYNTEFQHYSIGRDEFTLIITSNYDRRVRKMLLDIQKEILSETNQKAS
jgi:CubicO group peptidase (beta-lactamase class C family)